MLTFKYSNILARALLFFFLFSIRPVTALELVVIKQAGCHYCALFDAEIAPAYPNTSEGQKAPLRRVDLHAEWPDDLSNIRKESFTPTFVLVHENQELARLNGYPGDEHFWHLLNQMLESVDIKEK